MENETDPVKQIEQRIFEAIYTDDAPDFEINHVFSALMNMVVFQMAHVCPMCRKNIAARIRRDLPSMVNFAGQLAREFQADDQKHVCH
jgi:hypothetical protein